MGFIGSAVVRRLVRAGHEVLNLDKLTYAGNPEAVSAVDREPGYRFEKADIVDRTALERTFSSFAPDAVLHLAAESHVDRSIENADAFINTNIVGTHRLLDVALSHWRQWPEAKRKAFRFLMVSTDEVYGALGETGIFVEETAYAPNSPYAASKAAADHLARAWYVTYGLPVIITNCSNNYGPWQHPEKLIPTIIRNALAGQPIPIYGTGFNVRDWLYVEDHVDGLLVALSKGQPGEKYNFGGGVACTNLEIAHAICASLDRRRPRNDGQDHASAIAFVTDRPGHDFRYAVDAAKAEAMLGWKPVHDFKTGVEATVAWFLEHPHWFDRERAELARRGLMGAGPRLEASDKSRHQNRS
jgi:dTDP-glucose 4,6-dehydratase